jgi:transposase
MQHFQGAMSEQRSLMPYDSVAFRFIAGNLHPDHDTIATFRKRFLEDQLEVEIHLLMNCHSYLIS